MKHNLVFVLSPISLTQNLLWWAQSEQMFLPDNIQSQCKDENYLAAKLNISFGVWHQVELNCIKLAVTVKCYLCNNRIMLYKMHFCLYRVWIAGVLLVLVPLFQLRISLIHLSHEHLESSFPHCVNLSSVLKCFAC